LIVNPKNMKPFVSILTPTYNRRIFIQQYLKILRQQDYRGKIEIIIADDSDEPVNDLLGNDEIIKYHYFNEKKSLGFKRNFLAEEARGDILIHIDDDDYYPPERISHAVEILQKNNTLIAGSSQCFFYNTIKDEITISGPFGKNHGTAGTFAYFKDYINDHHFNNNDWAQEEPAFTKNFTIPMTQLDPRKTMIVIWHKNNTWDKSKSAMRPTSLKLKDLNVDIQSRRFYKKLSGQ